MTSLSINRQIYLAVGCSLALLAVLAGLSYFATSRLAEIFSGYKETANQTLAANELLEDISDAQLAAFAYHFNPSEDHANAVWQHLDDIAGRQREAMRVLADNDIAVELLRQVAASTEDYRTAFSKMTDFNDRSERIVTNLLSIGSRVRAKLTKIVDFASENGDTWLGYDAGVAQQNVLRGRFYNERFLLTNDMRTFESAMTFLSEAIRRVNSIVPRLYDPEMQKLAQAAIGEMRAFIGSANENRLVVVQRNDLRDNRFDATGRQIREELDQLLHSAIDGQRTMGRNGAKNTGSTLFFVVVISLGALCIGSALGIVVARHISGSVRNMADTMSELAGGNLDVAVTGTDQRHELGMMARALEVFKGHALNLQRSLEKERELSGLQRQFVAMVSHEFRTPLAIIDANAQRLQRRPDQLATEAGTKRIGSIRTSVMRLTDLMESVLAAARMEEGQIKFEPEAFDIRDMVSDTCRNYAEINKRHSIDTDLGALPQSYIGDIKLLRQVISNLVSNAVKYSPENTTVQVLGREIADRHLVISVKDQGVGIPEDEVEKLFERFFRASTSTGIPGSGIGLHLVKHLVDLHQGRMEVRSTVGKGTTFEIWLPPGQVTHPAVQDVEDRGDDLSPVANEAA